MKFFALSCTLAACVAPAFGAAVLMYDGANYSGTSTQVTFVDDQCTEFPYAAFQSLKIPRNYDCTLYAGTACTGTTEELTDSSPNLSIWPDSFECTRVSDL